MLQLISASNHAVVQRQPAFPPAWPVRARERLRRLTRECELTPPALRDSMVESPDAIDMLGCETGNGDSRSLLLAARTEAVGGVLILAYRCMFPQNAGKPNQVHDASRLSDVSPCCLAVGNPVEVHFRNYGRPSKNRRFVNAEAGVTSPVTECASHRALGLR